MSRIYSLQVTDDNVCYLHSLNFSVVEPAQAVIDSFNVTSAVCYGPCDGTLELFSTTSNNSYLEGTNSYATQNVKILCFGMSW